jgi:hypothetical protein
MSHYYIVYSQWSSSQTPNLLKKIDLKPLGGGCAYYGSLDPPNTVALTPPKKALFFHSIVENVTVALTPPQDFG